VFVIGERLARVNKTPVRVVVLQARAEDAEVYDPSNRLPPQIRDVALANPERIDDPSA